MKKMWILFNLFLLLPFQNCSSGGGASSYAMLNQASTQQTIDCANNVSSCLQQGAGDPTQLKLVLNSWVAVNVPSATSSIVISGTCASGNFARTRIYWELLSSAGGTPITTSLLNGVQTGCAQGVFSETITGFLNAQGTARFAAGTQLNVRFVLNGINDQGSLVTPSDPTRVTANAPINITP